MLNVTDFDIDDGGPSDATHDTTYIARRRRDPFMPLHRRRSSSMLSFDGRSHIPSLYRINPSSFSAAAVGGRRRRRDDGLTMTTVPFICSDTFYPQDRLLTRSVIAHDRFRDVLLVMTSVMMPNTSSLPIGFFGDGGKRDGAGGMLGVVIFER